MSSPIKPDEARRLAIDWAIDAGLNRDQATAIASSLLWFDIAGFPSIGLATLPEWLDRIARGEIDVHAVASVGRERAGTAQLDGRNGLPQATLSRAAVIAGQKARELGLAIVRVQGIGPIRSAAPMVADLAIGPLAGLAMGPQGAWSLALPTEGGLPLVHDAAFGDSVDPAAIDLAAPWLPLLPDHGWLVMALNLPAFEPLASFQVRTASAVHQPGRGRVEPIAWEHRRRSIQERGLDLPEPFARDLLGRNRS